MWSGYYIVCKCSVKIATIKYVIIILTPCKHCSYKNKHCEVKQ